MKIIDGSYSDATSNNVLTNFSPSPTHLDVRDEADILKNVACASFANALAMNVFPFPYLK